MRYALLFHLPRVWMRDSSMPIEVAMVAAPTLKLWPAYIRCCQNQPKEVVKLWCQIVLSLEGCGHESGIRGQMCCLVQKGNLKEQLLGTKHCLANMDAYTLTKWVSFWSFALYLHNAWGVRVVYGSIWEIQMCGRIVGCCIRDCDLTWAQETKKAKVAQNILSKSVGLRSSTVVSR